MRICILDDAYESSESPLKNYDLTVDPRPYLRGHECVVAPLVLQTATRRVIELSRQGFDLFFNLCDGAWDDDRAGIEVVQTLERLGLAFTGAASDFYEPSREAMKRVCSAVGVATPAYVIARTDADVARAADTLRFPLIVKHPSSYSSIALDRDSRVTTAAALRARAGSMMSSYGGALIEEFVEGREFTVLVAEDPDRPTSPVTFTPVEFRFPPGESFKHFDLKWKDYHGMTDVAVADEALDRRLRRMSAEFFVGLHGSGFGRCDIRMDRDGTLYMLEINPNCGVYYPASDAGSADFALLHDPRGHQGFTDLLLRSALARRARAARPWTVRPSGDGGYGLLATRAITTGETVVAYEGTPHTLVTRSHVEAMWDDRHKEWFRRYAWPLSDEVYVTWDPDPEAWRPVNHSCDPNTWLDGLDLIARRDIRAGEELTVDYATFTNEIMPAFRCACGAAGCRGTVTGDDWRRPFLARYGDHISDYVRRRRAAADRNESVAAWSGPV